jgi:ABC-type uncharacterized transport system, permease component
VKFSVVRRIQISKGTSLAVRLLSVVAALLLGAVLLTLLGHSPVSVYSGLFSGAVGTATRQRETVKTAVPLLGAALAITPAFKMRFWNIGAEGQILAGGIAASYFALFWIGKMPAALLLVVMFLAAVTAGGIWGFIPALFRAKWGTNETLFTLMLNYIILGLITFLQNGPWKSPTSTFPQIPMFHASLYLPKVLGVHFGWIFFLLLVAGMYIYMSKTQQGYELGAVGGSLDAARYAGVNVQSTMLRTMLISGGICGAVGFFQVAGANYTLTQNTAGGVGFTAITVAWLAGLNPFAMVPICLFLSILQKGAGAIQTTFGIPASASEVLTGLILFCMLAGEFFLRYRIVRSKTEKEAKLDG